MARWEGELGNARDLPTLERVGQGPLMENAQ
jgi:hypothetical protein